ncbi:unnamed protein product [Oncorhynchus mykiss]|uniref:Immunoglobulin C1-set domain-containing protein n=1 Tax=Oncorhynchus mykiss TaxID=8022 RepID=A0A060Z2K4_ONCMY|nr:unnamed protein product [Oncorhynchus mykiss]
MKHLIYSGLPTYKIRDDEAQDGAYVFGIIYQSIKERSFQLKHHLNLTRGVQVQQRIAGCEMLNNGELMIMSKNTFNAVFVDHEIYYNMTHFTYNSGKLLPEWDAMRREYLKTLFGNVLLPICIRTLKTILKREKNIVMRKTQVDKERGFWRAQGELPGVWFYPRHINLTLLRDGQPVAEQELTGGEVLPSGDGTYQLRKRLEVSTEELKKRHNYTCTASHLSLDNKLDVSWESGAERVHLSTLSALLVMLLVVILLGIFICVKRRRRSASQALEMNHSSDSAT